MQFRTGEEMRVAGNPGGPGSNEAREMVVVIIINITCYVLSGQCLTQPLCNCILEGNPRQ